NKETSGTEHYSYLTPFQAYPATLAAGKTRVELANLPTWAPAGFQLVIYRTAMGQTTDFRQVGTVPSGQNLILDGEPDDQRTDPLPPYVLQSLPGLTPASIGLAGTAPHADSRVLVFDGTGKNANLLEADDGGIYRLVNPGGPADQRHWDSLIGDLNIAEVGDVAQDPGTNVALIGTQDDGSQVQTGPGLSTWRSTLDGDGQAQVVQRIGSLTTYHYSVANNLRTVEREQFDGNGTLIGTSYPALS